MRKIGAYKNNAFVLNNITHVDIATYNGVKGLLTLGAHAHSEGYSSCRVCVCVCVYV